MNKTICIVVNIDWFFLSHRLPIALAAKERGYAVVILTKDTGRKNEIESRGLGFVDIPFERSGTNPLHEIKCIYLLYKYFRQRRPDIIHQVTLKAALLGSVAAKFARVHSVVNAISGFGYNFTEGRNGIRQKIIKGMMQLAFKSKSFNYIFQNPDDVQDFSSLNFVPSHHIHLIKGSGVDLSVFTYNPEVTKEIVRLVLPARMLFDKGVVEFIHAAKKIKEVVSAKAEFLLVGDCDTTNLAGIAEEALRQMEDEIYIRWCGFQKDMFEVVKNADIVVLPSYREGLPKSLIEACAVGRPIITTDTQGCRECVVDGYNGFLVPVKNVEQLADKMKVLILDQELRAEMGRNSRLLAEKEFSITSVVEKHLAIYKELAEK